MSPGLTFERIYRELKRRLADGRLRPGQPIEPTAMSAELAASITPIRDALHRLVGEQLVEAPNHNGFRVPQLIEAELRDLYLWNGRLLGLAARQIHAETPSPTVQPHGEVEAATAALFLAIAKIPGSDEHMRAIERLNDRLAPYRCGEPRMLSDMIEELDAVDRLLRAADRKGLLAALTRYHRRRVAAVPGLLAAAAG